MKKILFLIHDLGGGGAERVLVNLVNHLDYHKYDVHVIALFGGGVNERYLSSKVHYKSIWKHAIPGSNKVLRRLSPTLLYKICIKEKYDIEVAYLEDICAKVISGSKNKEKKSYCWVHSDLHDKKVSSRGFFNYQESYRAFTNFDGVVCVSETVKRDFKKLYPKVKRILVCYNTLETAKIDRLKKEPVLEIKKKVGEISLVAVGKICKLKGYDRLAHIIKKLRDDGYNVHLYALGEGPDKTIIEAYLKENDLLDYFTFLGYKLNPYKYIANCDLFVCASLSEGFSTATTEALVVGTPVCTVDVSGMREMLGENNEWGVITENSEEALYKGILNLVKDPDLMKYYKDKAAERGRAFSTANTVKAVENLFDNA